MTSNPVARRPIPGPVNRETFFDEQRRRRRTAWRFAVVSLLMAALIGAGVAALFTPTLYLLVAVALRIGNFMLPMESTMHELARVLRLAVMVVNGWFNHQPITTGTLARAVAFLILPSVAISIAVWILTYCSARRTGAGGALLALGSREPDRTVLAELELADIVSEMALASGLPPPRALVVDQSAANAGVVGTSPSDAAVVVSTGLLNSVGRDEIEGVIGHLVGSIGNGDVEMAIMMMATFQTIALIEAIIDAPFRRRSRSALFHWGRLILDAESRGDESARRAADLARLLTPGFSDEDDEQLKARTSGLKDLAAIPSVILRFAVGFYGTFLCGPFIALLWRNRQYLADATAVQLTRYPDGLSGALARLARMDTAMTGTDFCAQQFVVGGRGSGSGGATDQGFGFGSMHPSTEKRLARLRAMGAVGAAGAGLGSGVYRRPNRLAGFVGISLLVLLLGPPFAAVFALLLILVAVVNMVGAMVYLALVLLLLR